MPPGFLEVNGSVQSIATYPDLFAYLGTAFNTGGEGAGNFRLPESRGEFLRGWDHGRGIDAGRALKAVIRQIRCKILRARSPRVTTHNSVRQFPVRT